ncbi:YcaQ family DNA glycosylase [Gluconobacter cerinus]|uniref:DNA glycosylase AlkZ-like family protein n=1 Tax=Gluconobacter cerinus TaxID=38307 RepID=UPI001B8D960E|nr:YcaQ family DNA glycosylase [Gluconobacter cerinus]MBS1041911.1 YcaQ family DNA glycosylase [Gluconobacter cerinus]MBS1045576.1 YcaQ family DNA glycosylase [Gluconobacter cerinus]MBS1048499.1 YcaQ family DNA glycosylase [Gluconobacter cerinus]
MSHQNIQSISLAEAQKIAVSAQLFTCNFDKETSSQTVLEKLGCIQIDAIRAVRRSHELVFLSRGISCNENGVSTEHFETWGHAHSLMPLSLWPYMEWRRKRLRASGFIGPEVDKLVCKSVLKVISAEGPKTMTELEPSVGKGWNRASGTRWACEWLLSVGDLVCTSRNSRWQRIYSLPTESIPYPIRSTHHCDDLGLRHVIDLSMRALGIATDRDVADYFKISLPEARKILIESEYERVMVEGSAAIWYVSKDIEMSFSAENVVAISPLDSLVWSRGRQKNLFQRDYILESYKPKLKRKFGYFGMPVLKGHRIVGRVAPRKSGETLLIEAQEFDDAISPDEIELLLQKLSTWASCSHVIMERD